MQFSEKLIFLMNITQTSNKELAMELGVDRSLISLLRSGKRGVPKSVKRMARVFAERSTADFQRYALSDMLGILALRSALPVQEVADYLEKWLLEDRDMVRDVEKGLQGVSEIPALQGNPAPVVIPQGQAAFYFGDEGRREVLLKIMQEIRQAEKPCTVMMVVDDNMEWMLSDYALTKRIQTEMLELARSGVSFCQIVPPMNYVNRYTESLQFWLPLYATGKLKAYYYPRLRGNLYRHSIYVLPGHCAQFNTSIAAGGVNDVTMFTREKTLVDVYERQFREHLSMCRPALTMYNNLPECVEKTSSFLTCRTDTVQMINTLSLNSMPVQLLEQYISQSQGDWAEILTSFRDSMPEFEARLEERTCIDMCQVASAREILAGGVSVGAYPDNVFYTPQTYILHLENILRLMEKYDNYVFVPLRDRNPLEYNLMANEEGVALIVRSAQPKIVLEVRRSELVMAFRENMLHRADSLGYDGIHRERICMELRSLIQELKKAIR
ncbi:MAG: hypothetical protein ACI4PL_08245 [Faecousia sp.]